MLLAQGRFWEIKLAREGVSIALQREVVEVYGRSLGLSRADAVQASMRLQSMLEGPVGVEEAASGAEGDL